MHGPIGFSPGVFDLFHVGHLDVLRRAEEASGRLVAGVVTDELAEELYGVRPIVPLIERMEIVGDVRHVDRVVPVSDPDLLLIWAELGFETLFAVRPDALVPRRAERDLAARGVRVVRYTDVAETGSAVLRSALADGSAGGASGDGRRTSVA